ncbi:MAG: hypothetical protein GY940_46065, partial [bacterium]|nr:hypothetical protein [bacterium]
FLGSALTEENFSVVPEKQVLPATSVDPRLRDCDLIGFTLFEDMFQSFKVFLNRLKNDYKYDGLLAAGGPLITLTPMESAYHLPEINLMVRGEAEFVFPGLLKAVNQNDMAKLMNFSGFLFQLPGLVVISDYDRVNQPAHFQDFRFNLDFLEQYHMEAGMELNVSRGCFRGCIFCANVQGKHLRKLPDAQFDGLLKSFSHKLELLNVDTPHSMTLNINDDDILQDTAYAGGVFETIKENGYRLWGIQTSIHSFFDRKRTLNMSVVDLVADPPLYVEDNPLLWLGTDGFLKRRGKKLGKLIPAEDEMIHLLEELDRRKVRNYHYWISSDHNSDWEEFTREFLFIYRLHLRFEYFGLIGHAPFLIPYSSTPLYKLLRRSPEMQAQVKHKKILKAGREVFTFPLADRVETRYPHLNRLLRNEKTGGRPGFFDDLGDKDYLSASITLYNFLKQERLDAESFGNWESAETLKKIEREVEEFIGIQMSDNLAVAG